MWSVRTCCGQMFTAHSRSYSTTSMVGVFPINLGPFGRIVGTQPLPRVGVR